MNHKIRVGITTSRDGGTLRWGRDLAQVLNSKEGVNARHSHTIMSIISSPFHNIDILHSSVPVLPSLRNIPLIITIQGDYTIESRLWRVPYHITLKRADKVTIPSVWLKEKLNLDRAVIIPNAVFPDRFACLPRIDRDKVNIVTTCNFHFLDKVSGILDIINLLSKIDQHFSYTIAGGGKYLDTIKARHNTATKVNFIGHTNDVKSLLADSDIFLHYSYHDTFPIAILEAMASGLPVLTNDIGATTEIIDTGEDGFVAHNNDEYLEYLVALVRDSKVRNTIGQNAKAKVASKFNWDIVTDSFIKLYKEVL